MKLIIAEKHSVGAAIAKVVNATERGAGYLAGEDYLVSWCVGHLVELADPEIYDPDYKTWKLEHLPIIPEEFKNVISPSTADQFKILKQLMNRDEVTELIEATDAGREGELIFRLVYHEAGCRKPFSRLWISSVEEKTIREGLASLRSSREYDNLYEAALCRQHADWLIGINLTRLYTKMYHAKTLKVGRVQTPTLNFIVKRQREIKDFIPKPYYTITVVLAEGFQAYKRVESKEEAERIVRLCTGRPARMMKVEKEEKKENPIPLYDLTTLQREANRLLGYTSQQTLDSMQILYDSRLATYPRTDSRYLTEDMEESTVTLIDALMEQGAVPDDFSDIYEKKRINIKRVINNKKVTDHHAIIPTMGVTGIKIERLPEMERNILLMVVYRMFSAIYVPHTYIATRAALEIEGEEFSVTGKEILESGYRTIEAQMKSFLKVREEKNGSPENILPVLREGESYQVSSIGAESKKTAPPAPYTEDTLLDAMQTAGKMIEDDELRESMKNCGLGTTATRAGIIESLIHSEYIQRNGRKLIPTDKAYTFIDLVTEKVKGPDMTAEWEKQLYEIQMGHLSSQEFMQGILHYLKPLVEEVKQGSDSEAAKNMFQQPAIGTCPICGKKVMEYKKSYSCESGKEGCGFVIWKIIAKKNITETQVKKLLSTGQTDIIKGFESSAGKKFDAHLAFRPDKSVGFVFPQMKRKKVR